ncbi:MAG: hypothetical protein RL518_2167 [Pseudomonadota bacterium]|jgi:hypothetical protein
MITVQATTRAEALDLEGATFAALRGSCEYAAEPAVVPTKEPNAVPEKPLVDPKREPNTIPRRDTVREPETDPCERPDTTCPVHR